MAIILVVMLVIIAIIIYKDIYNSTSHVIYDGSSILKEDATIIDAERKVVGTKGHRRLRTTLYFSDGFVFISHKTDVENLFFVYKISTTSEIDKEIINDAFTAHSKMILKIRGNLKG